MTTTNANVSERAANSVRTLLPRTDVYASDETCVLVCELPGVAEADVEVKLDGAVLHVSARTSWNAPEGARLVHGEFEPVQYERRFRLGEHLDRDSIRATLRDGLLRIDVRARTEAARKIEIRGAS